MRKPEAQISTGIDALKSDVEGYVARMKRYPVLSREQTETALERYRCGNSPGDLRSHTLFQPHLDQEEHDLLKPEVCHASPIHSYKQLFADSPTIGHLVAFGNFPTIHYFVRKFQTTYKGLPLPLEEFMQDALYTIVPNEAKRYTPVPGSSSSFTSYISTMLVWRLNGLVDACIVERSLLPPGLHTNKVKPKHDGRRVYIESLDAPLPEETDNGEEVSLYDIIEDTRPSLPGEYLEQSEAIDTLFRQAGLTQKEAQVLQTTTIDAEPQEYAASKYGVTLRTIRYRRYSAIAKFRKLGYENVVNILNGERDVNPSLRR